MSSQLNMTAEQADRLTQLIKDQEFIRLFGEFAKEMQDPAASAEMNEYLRQLEAEGQAESVYGKGVQLITPEPSFVVKTKDKSGANRVYINICTSPKVGAMHQEARQGPSGNGVFLTIPMVIHAKEPKKSTAPDGGPVLVWDMAVNPNATTGRRGVLDMLVVSAMERVEEVSGTKLLREYKLPKLKYKTVPGAEQPSVMAARTGAGGEVVDGRLRPKSEAQAAAAGPVAETMSDCSTPTDSSSTRSRSSFSFESKTKRATAQPQQQLREQQEPRPSISDPSIAGYRHTCGAVTPSWRLTERLRTDLGGAWADTGRRLRPASNIPEALVIQVDLPGVESAGAMQLDVGSHAVHLGLPGKYMLDLTTAQLNYKLLADQGTAKYDKAKQQLTLTLKVAPLQQQQHTVKTSTNEAETGQQHQDMPYMLKEAAQQAGPEQEQPECDHQADVQQDAATSSAEASCITSTAEASTAAVALIPMTAPQAQQPPSKTNNQSLWDQVHAMHAGSVEQELQQQQQQPAVAHERGLQVAEACAMEAPVHHELPYEQTPHITTAAPLLKPRLLSRRLSAADLD